LRTIANKLRFCVGLILGFVIISLFGVLGVAIMFIAPPLTTLTCRYVETKQVDCQLQERVAWVIPVREIPVTHLKRAYVDYETETREDEDGREYTVSVARVILVGASGEIGLEGIDDVGLSATILTARVNDYLSTPTGEPLTLWGFGLLSHTLVTLVGGFVFILAVLILVLWIVELVVGIDTAETKVVGFYQKVKRKMVRVD
jgi:hypothetical protein